MSIRIGIDGMVTPTLMTGIGRYLENLIVALANINTNINCTVYLGANQDKVAQVLSEKVTLKRSRISTEQSIFNFLRMQLILPFNTITDNLHILHVPNEKLVLFKNCPLILTIHDVADFRIPKRKDFLRRNFRRLMMPLILSKADHLIAVSEKTAKDLTQLFKVPSQKITVISAGVSSKIRKIETEQAKQTLQKRWQIFGDYILFVGEVAINKNVIVLVEAFADLLKARDEKLQLVIVGKEGSSIKALNRKIREESLDRHVIVTGFVDDDELSMFYSAAKLFVLPSLYEGFGLPVVEAMSCGVPVIASDSGSLPEVIGDAGLIVDCSNPAILRDAMLVMVRDVSLRNQLIERGYERAKTFSWESAAKKTLEVYNNVVKASGSRYRI